MALTPILRKTVNAVLPTAFHEEWDNRKWLASIRRHHSRLHYSVAPKYTDHLRKCQAGFPGEDLESPLRRLVETFDEKGFATILTEETQALAASMLGKVLAEEQEDPCIWNDHLLYAAGDIYRKFPEVEALMRGDLGSLFRGIYGAHFNIYYGVLYKSERRRDAPEGSQIWHPDGGPGTCINVMFCLSEVSSDNGAMEFLPWTQALRLYRRERRAVRTLTRDLDRDSLSREEVRAMRADWYDDEIKRRYARHVEQPTGPGGLVIAFRNNVLHRGGFVPVPGRSRYVCVFHVYPSETSTAFEAYRERGIGKRAAYPQDPAEAWGPGDGAGRSPKP